MPGCLDCGFLKLITTYVGQCLAKNHLIWKKKLEEERWCEDYMPRIEWMLPEEHKKVKKDLETLKKKGEEVELLDHKKLEEKVSERKKVYKLPILGKVSPIKIIEGILKVVLVIVVSILVVIIIIATLIGP